MVAKYGLPDWLPEGWIYKPAGKNKKPVEGIGINDVEFACQPSIGGKQVKHPAYSSWYHMLERSFDIQWKIKKPSYKDVHCCDSWLLFSQFLGWFSSNYYPGYVLDKDLIVRGNKVYSPETCMFIPVELNSFMLTRALDRGDFPLGVQKRGNKFIASISYNDNKSSKQIGRFDYAMEAHRAWQIEKLELTRHLLDKYPKLPELKLLIYRLEQDITMNLETIQL